MRAKTDRFSWGRRFFVLALFLGLLLGISYQVHAQEAAATGSAVITFEGLPGADQEGARIGLYRVGEENVSAQGSGYSSLPSYASCDAFTRLLSMTEETITAQETDQALAQLAQAAAGEEADVSAGISDAKAVFEALPSGVYFGQKIGGRDELKVQPFLFFLPQYGGVTSAAKWTLTTHAQVSKVWEDADNQDGVRPNAVYAVLYQQLGEVAAAPYAVSGEEAAAIVKDHPGLSVVNGQVLARLDGGNDFSLTVDQLPKYADKTGPSGAYTYSWREVVVQTDEEGKLSGFEIPEEGILPVGQAGRSGYTIEEEPSVFTEAKEDEEVNCWQQTIINRRTPELTRLNLVKEWDDNDNQDGKRPQTIIVSLLANGQPLTDTQEYTDVVVRPDDAGEWAFSTGDLPVYRSGVKITYTWSEQAVAEYSKVNPDSVSEDGLTTTITNAHTPGKTSASVEKFWDDESDQDGIRPAAVTVYLQKKSGGDPSEESGWGNTDISVTLEEANTWRHTQENLDEYTNGQPNYYRWRENPLPAQEGHTPYDDPVYQVSGTTTTISNPHTPEEVSETVRKVWEDDNDQAGRRPSQISVQLNDGLTATTYRLSADNNWTVTVEHLPKYRAGSEINYVWTEVETNTIYYTTTTPQRNAAARTTTVTNTYIPRTRVSVEKSWRDEEDEDGTRPATVNVQLLANGQPQGGAVTLSASTQTPWSYTWTDLPTTDLSGARIAYSVEETQVPEGYTVSYSGNATAGFVVSNTHTPRRGSLRIIKNVTLNGAATTGTAVDGEYSFTITGPHDYERTIPITIRNGASNSVTVNDLPVGTYTVRETVPEGMTLTSENNQSVEVTADNQADIPNVTFVNNRTVTTPPPQTETQPPTEPDLSGGRTTVSGRKIWEDEGNAYNTRPASITVRLLANGTATSYTPTWSDTNSNTWSYTFSNLPQRDNNGETITYTVQEEAVSGYRSSISGTTITNTLIPSSPRSYVTISGTKSWADNANALGDRPDYITVRLLRGSQEVDSRTVTAANGWSYSFQDQPADDGYGHRYTYTVREDGISGYYARMEGNNITNNRIPVTDLDGGKPPANDLPPFSELTEEGLEEMIDLFDYDTPLWGGLLGTGDVMPVYPFVFGGIGVAALLILLIFGRRRKKEEGKG